MDNPQSQMANSEGRLLESGGGEAEGIRPWKKPTRTKVFSAFIFNTVGHAGALFNVAAKNNHTTIA
jgi:hypothetical protein